MVANIFIYGPRLILRKKKTVILEIFLQMVTLYCYIVQLYSERNSESGSGRRSSESTPKFHEDDLVQLILLRNWRLIRYLKEIGEFNKVYETTRQITKPILQQLFFIYLVFYVYAYFG